MNRAFDELTREYGPLTFVCKMKRASSEQDGVPSFEGKFDQGVLLLQGTLFVLPDNEAGEDCSDYSLYMAVQCDDSDDD